MSATFDLDSSGFRRAIGGLLQFTSAPLRTIVRAEVGSILKACVGDTKVAPAASVTVTERIRVLRDLGLTRRRGSPVSINAGLRGAYGRVWRYTGGGRVQQTHDAGFKPLWRHFGESVWGAIRTAISTFRGAVARRMPAALASRGLARQSWVQIADDAGIQLEAVPGGRASSAAIAKARSALASNGVRYHNGQAREYATNRGFIIELINSLPYGRKVQLDRILFKNINARAKFYEQNLARGVFDRLATIIRAYPGLRLQRN